MVKREGAYRDITAHIVSGRDSMGRPKVQVRPLPGQGLDTSLNIECSRSLREKYPVGTKLRMKVQLTDMEGTEFLYSYHGWHVEVVK
jgi:hypothetical protein